MLESGTRGAGRFPEAARRRPEGKPLPRYRPHPVHQSRLHVRALPHRVFPSVFVQILLAETDPSVLPAGLAPSAVRLHGTSHFGPIFSAQAPPVLGNQPAHLRHHSALLHQGRHQADQDRDCSGLSKPPLPSGGRRSSAGQAGRTRFPHRKTTVDARQPGGAAALDPDSGLCQAQSRGRYAKATSIPCSCHTDS